MRQTFDDLLTEDQCQAIMDRAEPDLREDFRPNSYVKGRTGCQLDSSILVELMAELMNIDEDRIQPPEIVRYDPKVGYGWHCDSLPTVPRRYTLVVGLNGGYIGGGIEFDKPRELVKLDAAGRGVLFDDVPRNMHRVIAPTAGVRWVAVVWAD